MDSNRLLYDSGYHYFILAGEQASAMVHQRERSKFLLYYCFLKDKIQKLEQRCEHNLSL